MIGSTQTIEKEKASADRSVESDAEFDYESDPKFLERYARESLTASTLERFKSIQEKLLQIAHRNGQWSGGMDVLDIGCGAGTQSRLWADQGHRVCGLDVNGPLIALARTRAEENGLAIEFTVGTATELPYADHSKDVCLMPELLEHVKDWRRCVDEAIRVLRPGGVLYLSTTNALCPIQQEFNLPFYSWYPRPLKRRFERLAVTTRPKLANFAKYPAVHWFTFNGLNRYLDGRGMECFDRFDMIETSSLSPLAKELVSLARRNVVANFVGHMLTEGTAVFANKRPIS